MCLKNKWIGLIKVILLITGCILEDTTYTVTFDVNGATSGSAPEQETVNAGSRIQLPSGSGLLKTGYTFIGWNYYPDNRGVHYNPGSFYTPEQNVILYAKWYDESDFFYSVKFDNNGGSGNVPPERRVPQGASIQQLPNGNDLSKDGFKFDGWSYYPDGSGDIYNAGSSYTPVINITFYAKWIIDEEWLSDLSTRVFRREYTTPVTNTVLSFHEGFPAVVEVYVLGAGGGGQGGHRSYYIQGLSRSDWVGTGGSGGGGSAAYMKFELDSPVVFNITVGGGGPGGTGRYRGAGYTWQSGYPGISGGSTSVVVGSRIITAGGGIYGGGDGQTLTGGAGGATGSMTIGLLDWVSASGEKGNDGEFNADRRAINRGGRAASINSGSEFHFGGGYGAIIGTSAQTGGGGRGGYNNGESGTRGGDGSVVIVITYSK
ncbi:MAG: InlB B-repeat-containing protein [Treponema sp.]|nr:InlB B-repeat-containing protein [Treponema sp.]